MKLFFIFPISGPNNGVKVISNHIKNSLFTNTNITIRELNTAQAKDFNNFGKFNLEKVSSFYSLFKKLFLIKKQDIVYLNFTPKGFAFYRDLIILLVCSFKTKNITAHIHANGLEENLKFYNKFLFTKIKIIVINQSQYANISPFCPNTFLVPNALPDYFQNDDLKVAVNKEINFIFLSNLSKEKGINRLIKIAEILENEKINCKLNILGGALSDEDETSIQTLNFKYKFISYFGPVKEDATKFANLAANDVLLFLSDENYEVYPLVYIEALMSGLPIITTKQIVTNNLHELGVAFILKNDSSNLVDILNDNFKGSDNLEVLKKKARFTYLENYSFKNFIKSLEKILLYDTRKTN
ncbi:glycosyltransferase [Formosa sp. PL04]|uniref:glycosyltransferase n=1 Tax=Formosa sp. PL04 TaxID=3081755 RepID=UPI0029816A95|nr:glycosyltransferase [Formosa sp. PL04]MDW5289005.1 glycosyltransferase [Formosa sp. PL04]